MSKVFIEESTLTEIGNAIRAKDGSTALIAPGDMADRIANLPTGGSGSETPLDELAIEMITGANKGSTITSLPNGITRIRDYAFYCSSSSTEKGALQQLALTELPDSITEIGKYAFSGCKNVNFSALPSSLVTIGDYSFAGPKFSTSLIIPANVNKIGAWVFGQTASRGPNELIFLGKPTSITSNAFHSGVTSIKVPWSEGEVAGAPWGANTDTIVYNYIHEEA